LVVCEAASGFGTNGSDFCGIGFEVESKAEDSPGKNRAHCSLIRAPAHRTS
jgi:hypothetical protein